MRRKALELPTDPDESARVMGLRYVTGEGPGMVRKRWGKGFTYLNVDGAPVTDPEELARIRSLAIPPAWTDVWICPLKTGHLQAVGRDAKGRKQYRYHPLYRVVRDHTKFSRLSVFGKALPSIRERVAADLQVPGVPRNKVLATIVRLLEKTFIRVGNDEYAKHNESFGLTTLQDHHVEIQGKKINFHFKGKSGQWHDIQMTDKHLAKVIAQIECIPGHELFHYIDDDGQPCRVYSEDVNAYLGEMNPEHFTAKDFRTWGGTCQAALELERIGPADTKTERKRNVVAAIKVVASKLGNKASTCRNYYVHPAILAGYENGSLFEALAKAEPQTGSPHGLKREEVAVMNLVAGFDAALALREAKAAA